MDCNLLHWRIKDALRGLDEFLVKAPHICIQMGQLYLIMKRFEQAEHFFSMAVHDRPNFPGYRVNYANFLFIVGNYQKAIDQFKSALQKDPNNLLALEGLGGTYWKLGKHKKAIANFEKLIKLNPSLSTNTLFTIPKHDSRPIIPKAAISNVVSLSCKVCGCLLYTSPSPRD